MLGNRLTGSLSVKETFLSDVKPFMVNADVAFANLEGPIGGDLSEKKSCSNSANCHTFSQALDAAIKLKEVGFNVVSVANNHAQDLGNSGKKSTMYYLSNSDIDFVGYPEKLFTYKIVKNKKIGFVAFSANRGLPDYRNINYAKSLIEYGKSNSDFLIVSMHAGCEGEAWLRPRILGTEVCFGEDRGNVISFAKSAVDFGEDLVLGHGPHVPRGVLNYKNKPIFLSLGNFATAKGISVSGKTGLAPLLKIALSDDLSFKKFDIISFRQQFDNGPKLDVKQESLFLINTLTKELN